MRIPTPVPVLVAVVSLLFAGCAAPVVASADSTPTPMTTPTEHTVAGHTAGPTLAGNRQAAEHEANRLLTLARVPYGATDLATPPRALTGPPTLSTTDSAAAATRYWRVQLPYPDALEWLRNHPPTGLTPVSSFTGGSSGNRSSGFGYAEPDSDAWTNATLQLAVAPLAATTSAVAAAGQVIWLDPDPVRDTRTGPRMHLTVGGGCPATDAGIVSVVSTNADLTERLVPDADPTGGLVCRYDGANGNPFGLTRSSRLDAGAATLVAQAARRLRLSHPTGAVPRPCPFDDGQAVVVALSFPARPDVALWFSNRGCPWVSNGAITAEAGELGQAIDAATTS